MNKESKEYQYILEDEKLREIYDSDTISIYESDLKYTKMNNINLNNIREKDGSKCDITDRDTVKFRILDCIKNGGITLDLSHLGLTKLPNIPKELNTTLKYLFLSENKLEELNAEQFTELLVLDICNNNLNYMPLFGEKVEELLIKKNNISTIFFPKNTHLKRFDCSENLINDIPFIKSLEILICSYNKLVKICNYPNLIRLACKRNNIKILDGLEKLEVLDCDKNNLEYLGYHPNLKELFCCYNNIAQLDLYKKIMIIHCHHNNITQFEYLKTLRELVCDYSDNMILSKKYSDNILSSDIYQNDIIQLRFKII